MTTRAATAVPDGPVPRRLAGAIAAAFLVHNVEEALTVGAALPTLAEALGARGPLVLLPTAWHYQLALAVITATAFALLAIARRARWAGYALLALQATMALNVGTHVAGAALLRGYAPGVATAIAVELPVSAIVFAALARARALSPREWRWLPAWAVVLHGPALLALLGLVRVIPS